jgi:PAS domain-containing protein
MTSETPNRAAADLLPLDLVPAVTRDAVLANPLPALLLGANGKVLFASHAFARRLGYTEGAALMGAGLPPLAPSV